MIPLWSHPIAPAGTFSAISRPAGTQYFKRGTIDGVALALSNYHGYLGDTSANPSKYADANGVFKTDGASRTIIWHGDSITGEVGGPGAGVAYGLVQQTVRALTVAGKAVNYKQRGINGQGLGFVYTTIPSCTNNLTVDAPINIDPAYVAGAWLVIFAGSNDITLNGQTGAQTWTLLSAYITARIAAGWPAANIIVGTCLPRASGNPQATNQNAYNSSIKSNAAGTGYKVADFASDAIMGNAANTTNTLYYADTVHPTVLGASLLVPYITAQIT